MKIRAMLRYVLCALIAAITVGETCAQGVAPLNPDFLSWQKKRRIAKPTSNPALTNAQSRTRMLNSSNQIELDEPLDSGLIPEPFDSSYLANLNLGLDYGVQDALPAKYDLRTLGFLTPVKNQNPYGTCWAHATLGALESSLKKSESVVYDFSENNMANLHGWDLGFNDGGNAAISSAYLLRWGGPVLESADPYPNPGGSTVKTPVRHVQRVRWIPGRSYYFDLDNIKKALMECGALYVSYLHDSYFYNKAKSSYCNFPRNGNGGRKTNHAVTLVGWDDGYSKSNFNSPPPGDGAFIVRNSWGSSWGEDGYFYVSYYDESFAWGTVYAFPGAEPADNYDAIYQYDPLGMFCSAGYGSASAWGAAMFTASATSKIAAVGFYALTPSTSYTISVYTGCTVSKPVSGILRCQQNGKVDDAGYVTVPLSEAPSVSTGMCFSIVVKLTTPGYKYPLAFEYSVPGYTSFATASSNETFLSRNGRDWKDFTSVDGSANFCCKAYTKSAVAAKRLSSIAISGVSSIKSGSKATFTCRAKYSDGSLAGVVPAWSVVSGSSYASISADGVVSTGMTTSPQTAKVQASYTEGGVTKTASWTFNITVAAPAVPQGLTATQGDETSCVRLTWSAVEGASSYAVYRGTTASSANAQYQGDVTACRYSDTTAAPGVKYYYFLKAKNSSGSSAHSAGALGWRALSAPSDIAASDGVSLDYVDVTWTAVTGAMYYRVYRSVEEGGAKTALGPWQNETSFRDSTAAAGVVYCYYVASAIDSYGNMASGFSLFDDGFRMSPVTLASIEIKGAASIISGGSATYSCAAAMTDGTVKRVSPSWSIASGSDYATVLAGQVTAKTVSANQTVELSASYTVDGVTKHAKKTIAVTAIKPSAPTGLAVVSQTTAGIALSWTAVPDAAAYKVYRAVGGAAATVLGSATPAKFTDKTAMPGVSCTYWVSAVNGAGESDLSTSSVTGMIPFGTPSCVSATVDRTDGVAVTWSALPGATHYRVCRATSAAGAKTDLGVWQTGTTYLDTSAVAGTTYWYFVRASSSSAGANASGYSTGVQGVRKVAVALSSIAIIGGAETVAAGGSLVFSCLALYSDGTSKAVKPVWSVSPASAATIGANGVFKAEDVSSDVKVTVTARYTEGAQKTAVKTVTIIASAPANPMVSVSGITAKPRWPFIGLVDVDYNVSATPEGTKASVSVSGFDHDRNVPLAARTLTGEGASGPVEAGKRRITWNVAADYPGFHAAAFSVTVEVAVASIAVPSGLTASLGTSAEHVALRWEAVPGATSYEIWRSTSNDSSTAEMIGTGISVSYMDGEAEPGRIYYYWVKSVASYATSGFAAEGVAGSRQKVVTITFNANGGTVSPASKTYAASFEYGTLPTPTRSGYVFEGWFTAVSGGMQIAESSVVPDSAITLYARWAPVTVQDNTMYMVIDLSGGKNASDYPVTYLNAVPAGGWTDEYKTGKIVLRKIPAGTFKMGDEAASVKISKPFYIGVFEVTQKQYALVTGSEPSSVKGNTLPVECLAWNRIRGIQNWPNVETVSSSSFVGLIRSKTGLDFDLPTEAQWEYACRAGTTTSYYWGDSMDGRYAWYWDNSGAAIKSVGMLRANDWGLYDMIGNVYELCLDWYQPELPGGMDPMGHTSGIGRTLRGGCSTNFLDGCTSSYRACDKPASAGCYYGFRLSCPAAVTNETVKTLISVSISGPAVIVAGDSATYTCTAAFSDGTSAVVMPSWSLSSGTSYAAITSSGVLTANGLTSQRSVAVRADYTFEGVTLTAEKKVTVNSKSVAITFDANGGTVSPASNTYTAYAEYGTLPTPTRSGYTFAGWFTASTGGTRVTESSVVPDSAITLYAQWTPVQPDPPIVTPDKVQLWEGGPYWATKNIGAKKPEDYGYYFWWGDTVGYKRENDKFVASDGSNSNFSFNYSITPTYHKDISTLQTEGWITSDGVLAPEYDAAHVHWGGDWRMPTKQDFEELISNCDWTWATNGVNGYVVRGRGAYSANSIFIPGAGLGSYTSLGNAGSDGCYWSSVADSDSGYAWNLGFGLIYHSTRRSTRYDGRSIRPVQGFMSESVPAKPMNVSATDGTSTANVTVTWSEVSGATSYEIWRGTSNSSSLAMKIGASSSTSYSDTSATPGTTYYYWVKAVSSSGSSSFSSSDSGYRLLSAPTNVSATDGTSTANVTVTWSAVSGATSYEIWRGMSNSSSLATKIGASSSTSYSDTSATPGTTYYYWVKAVSSTGTSSFSSSDSGYRLFSAPTNVSATDGTSTANVTVTWSAVSGAISYEIWRGTSNSSSLATKIGTSSSTSYSDTSATPGTTYYYWVKAVSSSGSSAFSSSDSGYIKSIPEHDKVQLWEGGPYWATKNIGAEKPEDYGYYFWWGDTVGYKRENDAWVASDGSSSNFSFAESNTPTYDKDISTLQTEGWITSDGVLAPEHDAARAHWGGDWRMPTIQELQDLYNNCDWTWATNGVNGYVVRGRGAYASASIFFPCAGYGDEMSLSNAGLGGLYWSSVPMQVSDKYAWYFGLDYEDHNTDDNYRYYGHCVRPLQGLTNTTTTVIITFDANGGMVSPTNESYAANIPYGTLPTPTRPDYTFVGWFTASIGGTRVTEFSVVPDSAITLYAQWTPVQPDPPIVTPEKVQLWEGGPYWATKNIGAEKPEDYGYYFWWGDTVGYKRENDAWVASDGSNSNFEFCRSNTPTWVKSIETLQSEGWITAEGVLAPEHDAAQKHWGGDWRMPTKLEFEELIINCDWTTTRMDGIKGYVVRGRGDYASNSIFLPCAGCDDGTSYYLYDAGLFGYYWSSVPYSDSIYNAWHLCFGVGNSRTYNCDRYRGLSVRPLQGFTNTTTTVIITFDANGGMVSPITSTYTVNIPYGTFPTPARSGYTFVGWFTASIGGTRVTESSVVPVSAITLYAQWTPVQPEPPIVTPDKVQLWEGGPYWATKNIGAEKPEDYGYYFWWGDTVGYKWENDAWVASDGSNLNFEFCISNTPTYYKDISTLQTEGWITSEGVLAPEHDAARAHWGVDWRMPTIQDLQDLCNNCDWTWATTNGVNGYVVSGRGDYASNSIFLPCAGYGNGTSHDNASSYGNYWSSVPYSDDYYRDYGYARELLFYSGDHGMSFSHRLYGQSVRPVQRFTK